MSNISLTFVAHQPNRLIHYDFFKIGEHAFYEEDVYKRQGMISSSPPCMRPEEK